MDWTSRCLFATISVCLQFMSTSSRSTSSRPHIILIVADDLGYNDVGFHGSNQIPTPNIDHLAHTGVILNNYYVSPICTPTRAALLTGRHPIHTGMQNNVIVGDQPYGLPLDETLMSQHLNTLGYTSHIVGKWHLGMFKWAYTPLYRGFKSHLGYYQGCEDYYDHTYEAKPDQWGLDFRKDKELLWNYTGNYSTDIFREEAVNIISKHKKSEPLFLYLPFQAVHSGNKDEQHLQAPDEYIAKFKYIQNKQRRIYAAMVSALDDAVGHVYDALRSSGLLSNSIIIFTTDNGGPANGFDYNAANNFPLRGVKATLWEGGIRGVGFVHSPLLKKPGTVLNHMLHVCDWLPTVYSAAGGNPWSLKGLDGFDAWAMLNGNDRPVRNEILHNIDPISERAAIRVGDMKLLFGRISMGWGGWYPPFQLDGDEVFLHYANYTDDSVESADRQDLRNYLQSKYRHSWSPGIKARTEELSKVSPEAAQSNILLQNEENRHHRGTSKDGPSVVRFDIDDSTTDAVNGVGAGGLAPSNGSVPVNCGPKPANASKNCNPSVWPCLYNVTADPCEYNNVAELHPSIVEMLFVRLTEYAATMVYPANKPFDDKGNPRHHGGTWMPWQK